MAKRVALRPLVAVAAGLLLDGAAAAQQPRQLVPWLDLPASWTLSVKDGLVEAVPGDLSMGERLVLRVEPEGTSARTLDADYQEALGGLGGTWHPIGQPSVQPVDGGWTFEVGVGTVTVGGTVHTAQVAVARCGPRRVRSWILASTDAVFNRYTTVTANAVASAQDITLRPQPGAPVAAAAPAGVPANGRVSVGKLPAGFGEGVSGVYLGLERGLHMHAGYGIGSPSVSVEDDWELDVFFPDGRYRRRFPDRGLVADPDWERSHGAAMWGTWTRAGTTVTVRRSGTTTVYQVKDGETLVSDRGRPWNKLPTRPGHRLDGLYASSTWLAADGPRLLLRPDGSYEDRGGFLGRYAGPESLVVPDGLALVDRVRGAQLDRALGDGHGTYTFTDFTLTLRDVDGRVWQVGLGVPPGEKLPSPRELLMDQSRLIRQ